MSDETPEAPMLELADFSPEATEPPIFEPPNPKASKDRRKWFRDQVQRETTAKTRSPKGKSAKAIPNRKGQFVEPVTQLYMFGALALMPFDPQCAQVLANIAPKCAEAWDDLAHKNDAVRRFLWGIVQTNSWATLLAAHAPLLIAAMTHHVKPVRNVLGDMDNEWIQNIVNVVSTPTVMDDDNAAD